LSDRRPGFGLTLAEVGDLSLLELSRLAIRGRTATFPRQQAPQVVPQ
jgi:hypothetical protein